MRMLSTVTIAATLLFAMSGSIFADIPPPQEKPFKVQLMQENAQHAFDSFLKTNPKATKAERSDGLVQYQVKTLGLTIYCMVQPNMEEQTLKALVCYVEGKGFQSFLESPKQPK